MGIVGMEEFSFGPFRLSVRRRTLSAPEGPIALSSRAFDLLVALIESRHQIISKDDLMRRVWGDVIVEENNLHVQIGAIRRALGSEHNYILTVPARGYRFVADFTIEESAIPDAAGDAVVPQPPIPELLPTRDEGLNNLPAQMTVLIGRAEELEGTCLLLEQARLVTLVGPGGVGKTKLALASARSLIDRFEAGCWLVELGAVEDAGLLPSAVASSLKVEETQDRPLTESVLAALRNRSTLLIMDGCEHLSAAVADLAGLLLQRCPQLRILCTSQVPLGLEGERVCRIAPLDVPISGEVLTAESALRFDAVRLFAERASAGDSRFAVTDATAAGVVEICRSLDGIPFAIELAAARVSLLGLEPIRERIANKLALLGDIPDRGRMLRAAMEWSYGLLSDAGSQILRRLSIFAGGFTLAAAQEVAAGSGFAEWDILNGVGTLVQRSLLTTGPDLIRPRHQMLGAMRDFALEKLSAAEERLIVSRRHAEYFLMLSENIDAVWEYSGFTEWMEPFVPEIENLRVALGWSLGPQGDPALGARLAAATARFWFDGGHLSEGRRWLTRALAQAPVELDAATTIRLKRGLADLSINVADAVTAAREAVVLADKEGAAGTTGVCLRMLSAALCRAGQYAEAEQAVTRALDLLRGTEYLRSFAKCLSDLCILRGIAGNYSEARRFNAEAQARLKALGDDRCAAICLQYAAEFEFAAGEVAAAVSLGEQSTALFRTSNSRFHLGIGLGNLAAYHLAQANSARAQLAAVEALLIAYEIEDHPGVVINIEHIALASASLGAVEVAAKLYGYVEDRYRMLGMERQGTEAATHNRLLARLADAFTPERQSSLAAEGQVLGMKAAVAIASGAL